MFFIESSKKIKPFQFVFFAKTTNN